MNKMDGKSMDLIKENIAQLKILFPEAVTEGKIDFDVLKGLLGEEVENHQEYYKFTWNGKEAARAYARTRSMGTLRPYASESLGKDGTPGKFDSENLYIEGDNLEVLKLLQGSYYQKVKMIYIDPPYNTGKDFIYSDNFRDSIKNYKILTGQIDGEGKAIRANPETSGRFHTDWLNMMYPRLILSRSLLREDGIIFISIDDTEVENMKKICNEIFGEQNFIGCAGRITKKSNNKGDFWAPNFDYLLTYVKEIGCAESFLGGINESAYNQIESDGPRKGEKYQLVRLYMSTIQNRNPEQRFWITCPDGSKIIPPGTTFPPQRPELGDGIWRWTKTKFNQERDKIVIKRVKSSNLLNENCKPANWNVYTKTYLNDVINSSTAKPNSFIEKHINQIGSHELGDLDIPFDYSKPTTLISYLMEVAKVCSNDIILDFFSGSATTAHSVLQTNISCSSNKKFIMVQFPEKCDEKSKAFKEGYKNICEIGKERIRRASKKLREENPLNINDKDMGFKVFKLDTSNFVPWNPNPDDIQMQLSDSVENLIGDRTKEDLIYEILLKCNFPLTLPIGEKRIGENTIYIIGEGELVICLDKSIPQAIAEEIVKIRNEYKTDISMQVVFRDNGFTDIAKANALTILKQAGFDEKSIQTI